MSRRFALSIDATPLAICRLDREAAVPGWALAGRFASVTRTPAELSIVCDASAVPAGVQSWQRWVRLTLDDAQPLDETGVIATIVAPLAAAHVPVFTLATFDTDHVLVPAERREAAVAALEAAGHRVHRSPE